MRQIKNLHSDTYVHVLPAYLHFKTRCRARNINFARHIIHAAPYEDGMLDEARALITRMFYFARYRENYAWLGQRDFGLSFRNCSQPRTGSDSVESAIPSSSKKTTTEERERERRNAEVRRNTNDKAYSRQRREVGKNPRRTIAN